MAERRRRDDDNNNNNNVRRGELAGFPSDLRRRQQLRNGYEHPFSLYAAQNNLGVIRLREKRYLDAANCFCQAVKYVNEHRSMDSVSPDNYTHGDNNNNNNILHNHNNSNSSSSSNNNNSSSQTNSIQYHHDVQNQTLSPMESSDGYVSGSDETPSSSSSSSERIDSFYLLLDQDAEGSNDYSTQQQGCSCDACQEGCADNPKTNNNTDASVSDSLEAPNETYVFRNPIIVSKRGVRPTTLARPANNNPPRPIDQETCSKLSLISVYNMALTYHLAALDKDNQNQPSECEFECNCDDNPLSTTPNDEARSSSVTANNSDAAPSSSGLRKTRVLDGADDSTSSSSSSSSCEYTRPKKKQRRVSLCNKGVTHHCTRHTSVPSSIASTNSAPTNSGTPENPIPCNQNNNDTNVDTVLLGQALSYYQIAYRILVSKERVLVSQTMVILNNIGHIHRLMGNEATAQTCFRRLLTTMIYLQQQSGHQQIRHWDSFLGNVIDLIVAPEDSHKRFAPAA